MPRRRRHDGDHDRLDDLDLPRLYESSSSPLLAGQDIPWRFTLDDHDHDHDDTLDLCSVFLNGTNLSRSGDASLLPFASPLCRGATPSLLETDAANRFFSVDVPDSISTTAATATTSYTKMRARESPSDNPTPSLHAMSLHDTEEPRQLHQQQHRHQNAQAQHLLSPRSFTAAVLGPSAASHMPLPTSHSGNSIERRTVTMPSEGAHLLTTSLHPSTAWGATHGSGHPTHPAWLAASLPSFSEGWTPSILPPSAAPQTQHDTSSSSISSFEMPAAAWTPLEQLREAATRFADNEDGSQHRGSPQAHSPASSDASSTATVTPRTFAQETHQQAGPSNSPSSSRHQISLPIRLPPPALAILSDPYADLSLHFMRHGLRSEVETLGSMPPDFILHNYLTIKGGPAAMFGETEAFGVRHGREVRRQLGAAEEAAMSRGGEGEGAAKGLADSLPESIVLDTQVLDAEALRSGMLPTHLLVVLSSMPEKTGTKGKAKAPAAHQNSSTKSADHIIIPIHSLLYVLQCVSLPPLPPSSSAATPTAPDSSTISSSATAAALSETREFPIVPLRVPRPDLFHLTHRFIYSHDTQALLADLAPLERLSQVLREREEVKRGSKGKGAAVPSGAAHSGSNSSAASSGEQVIMVAKPSKAECQHLLAAHVSAGELLEHAQRVHGAWANGVALGLTTGVYWRTLERAWDLVVGALLVQQRERERKRLGGHGGQGQGGTAGGMGGKAGTAGHGNGRMVGGKGKAPASRNRKGASGGHGSTKSATSSAAEAASYKRQRRDGGQAEGSQTPRGTPVSAMRA